jgi:tRNA G18 (ribose-2'-O)-methylase SpoU
MNFEYIKIKKENESAAEDFISAYPELELFFSLNESQLLHYYEPELGLFVVESPMVIERALTAGYVPKSFVMVDSVADDMCKKFEKIIKQNNAEFSEDMSIPIYVGEYETIAKMTGVNITRGVLALMKRRELPELRELVKDYNRIAVFDDVENPTNVGAMFRSAAALGIEAVILTGASSDPLYRRASRVSVGTVFQVPWTKLGKKYEIDLKKGRAGSYIEQLHELGFKTAAMALADNSVNIDDKHMKEEEKLAIILGNEGFGLSEEIVEKSDYVVKIPMKHDVDSLNVAAACSIAFWEVMKLS